MIHIDNKYLIKWLSLIIFRRSPENIKSLFRLREKTTKKSTKSIAHRIYNETCIVIIRYPKYSYIYIYIYTHTHKRVSNFFSA